MTSKANPSQLTTRQLLVTTATVAIAFGMVIADQLPVWIRLLGIASGFYSCAMRVFAVSLALSSPKREMVFMIGLPMYLFCVLAGSAGCLILLVTIYVDIFR